MSDTSPYAALLTVQELDTVLDQLRHRRENLPERAELKARQAALTRLAKQVGSVQADRDAVARTEKRLEDEIALVKEKAAKADRDLYSGATNSPKELQAIQDEIASLNRRISDLEDEELEAMEQAEPLDAELARLADEQGATDEECTKLIAAIAEAEVGIDAELVDTGERRAAAAAGIEASTLASYESLRVSMGGIAVAKLVGTRCDGCHLTLPAVEVDRIRHQPPEAEVTCSECGRILVR